ncbi:hypothetical protein P3705_26960, partial [Vibrio parahaemolyticus]|nr:hypothetical protein [Vibrio parahaemolyticus]
NRVFLSSAALSISDFEVRTNGDYENISVYEKMYSDSSGMLNYHDGVGELGTVKGLILTYEFQGRAYVYYNGKFAYSAEITESLKKEIKQNNATGEAQKRWEQTVSMLSDWQNQSRNYSNIVAYSIQSSQQIITVMLLVTGVYRISEGLLSMGGLIAIVMLSGRAAGA